MVRCKVIIDWEYDLLIDPNRKYVRIFIYSNHIARSFLLDLNDKEMRVTSGWGNYAAECSNTVGLLKKRKSDKSGGYIYLNDLASNMFFIPRHTDTSTYLKINNTNFYKRLRYEYFLEKVFIYGNFKKRFNERQKGSEGKTSSQGKNKA